MDNSSRLYHCVRCHAQVIICRHCDRGQRYCTHGCSQVARHESLKRANKKYQTSRMGRFNNASRQKRFRQRQQQKVTDQSSHLRATCGVVIKPLRNALELKKWQTTCKTLYCHHCGEVCGPFLRSEFIKNSRFNRLFRRR